ncbi:alpha/beta fold hydrolase [Chryseobacterium sp. DT-3]|uniref:alpha/beta fold hydrolase n=1 Tax=Chryseobacterium sp. DT-3 TaxID=3396164 RepID=UPI003F1B58EE
MEERIIEVRGQKLYITYNNIAEEKPVIIFLHDSLGCSQLWRDMPEKLSEITGCNILMYDRLGYGNPDLCLPMKSRLIIWNWKLAY